MYGLELPSLVMTYRVRFFKDEASSRWAIFDNKYKVPLGTRPGEWLKN